jgi:hypothetical protein
MQALRAATEEMEVVAPAGIPKERRAAHLRGRLQPDRLLEDLDAATQPNRPFVELIGIKASTSESEVFDREWVPEFKNHLQNDPAITEQIRPYIAMGFRFRWTGYFDPTGIECSFAIERNPEAERKLREWIEGSGASNLDSGNQLPLL